MKQSNREKIIYFIHNKKGNYGEYYRLYGFSTGIEIEDTYKWIDIKTQIFLKENKSKHISPESIFFYVAISNDKNKAFEQMAAVKEMGDGIFEKEKENGMTFFLERTEI